MATRKEISSSYRYLKDVFLHSGQKNRKEYLNKDEYFEFNSDGVIASVSFVSKGERVKIASFTYGDGSKQYQDLSKASAALGAKAVEYAKRLKASDAGEKKGKGYVVMCHENYSGKTRDYAVASFDTRTEASNYVKTRCYNTATRYYSIENA